MTRIRHRFFLQPKPGFTLIELLVVISIISLLISILMPSLSRARDQAKKVHCLARLREFGTALAAYENNSGGALPPPEWYPSPSLLNPPIRIGGGQGNSENRAVTYGWTEILFSYVYAEEVRVSTSFPVLRNVDGDEWQKYFQCKSAGEDGESSGHYRVYLPSWSAGSYVLDRDGKWGNNTQANPRRGAQRENIRPKMPLIGDANDLSERGDGVGNDDCSFIDGGEANYAGTDGRSNGNRFSDRHYGGTNFLFQDLHGEWSVRMRADLARDFDLNGVDDIDRTP
ncbi:MAG: prepilin-type N-terminal cleavage/methylation domain-containing protein [Planctomycetota bacterium]